MSDEYKKGYKHGYADAMNWKTANHLEHLPVAQPAVALEHEWLRGECVNCGQSIERQEPVAWLCKRDDGHFDVLTDQTCKKCFPVYTTPPQRTWVGLTDEDKKEYVAQDFGGNRLDAMDWAEHRLKEKNTNA